MKYYIYIYIIIVFSSCSHSQLKVEDTIDLTTIDLAKAIANMRPVKLSELADTLIYLPLETGNVLIGNRPKVTLSSRYIYVDSYVFDWNGKYLYKIGRIGQGPGEGYLPKIIDIQNNFYGMGDKLISFDTAGKYIKERSIIDMKALDIGRADSNIAICTADTILFMTKNFSIVREQRVVEPWPEKTTTFNINRANRFFSENNNSVLYYNYINDTIFHVLKDTLLAHWVIDLGKEKIPLKHLLGNELKRYGIGARYFEGNNMEDWDYIKETDNKIRSFAIYETDNILLIHWLKMREFWQLRNYPHTILQVAYYNKKTGETVAVSGEGFIDDLSSLGTFYPLWGTHGNFMITSYWPFELREIVKNLEQSGISVDENLLNLLSNVTDNDNPVLVMVHLKI